MSTCSCYSDIELEDEQSFWKRLAKKYERRIRKLTQKKCEIRRRLEVMQLQMPAYFCYNMMQMPEGAAKKVEEFVKHLQRPREAPTGSLNINCTCDPCPIKVPENFPENLYDYKYQPPAAKYKKYSYKSRTERPKISDHTLKKNLICNCDYCAKMVKKRLRKEEGKGFPLADDMIPERDVKEEAKRSTARAPITCNCCAHLTKAFKDKMVCECEVCAEEVIRRINSPDLVFEPLSCGCEGITKSAQEDDVDRPICQCDSCKIELNKRLGLQEEQKDDTKCFCKTGQNPNLICDCKLCADNVLSTIETSDCECKVQEDLPMCSCTTCKKPERKEELIVEDGCLCKCDVCDQSRQAVAEANKQPSFDTLCICNCDECNEARKEPDESPCTCEFSLQTSFYESSSYSCECSSSEESGSEDSVESCACSEEVALKKPSIMDERDVNSCSCQRSMDATPIQQLRESGIGTSDVGQVVIKKSSEGSAVLCLCFKETTPDKPGSESDADSSSSRESCPSTDRHDEVVDQNIGKKSSTFAEEGTSHPSAISGVIAVSDLKGGSGSSFQYCGCAQRSANISGENAGKGFCDCSTTNTGKSGPLNDTAVTIPLIVSMKSSLKSSLKNCGSNRASTRFGNFDVSPKDRFELKSSALAHNVDDLNSNKCKAVRNVHGCAAMNYTDYGRSNACMKTKVSHDSTGAADDFNLRSDDPKNVNADAIDDFNLRPSASKTLESNKCRITKAVNNFKSDASVTTRTDDTKLNASMAVHPTDSLKLNESEGVVAKATADFKFDASSDEGGCNLVETAGKTLKRKEFNECKAAATKLTDNFKLRASCTKNHADDRSNESNTFYREKIKTPRRSCLGSPRAKHAVKDELPYSGTTSGKAVEVCGTTQAGNDVKLRKAKRKGSEFKQSKVDGAKFTDDSKSKPSCTKESSKRKYTCEDELPSCVSEDRFSRMEKACSTTQTGNDIELKKVKREDPEFKECKVAATKLIDDSKSIEPCTKKHSTGCDSNKYNAFYKAKITTPVRSSSATRGRKYTVENELPCFVREDTSRTVEKACFTQVRNDVNLKKVRRKDPEFKESKVTATKLIDDSKLRESCINEYDAFYRTKIITPAISGLSCKKKHIVEDELPCYLSGEKASSTHAGNDIKLRIIEKEDPEFKDSKVGATKLTDDSQSREPYVNQYNAFYRTKIVIPAISSLSCKKKHIVEEELPYYVREDTSRGVEKASSTQARNDIKLRIIEKNDPEFKESKLTVGSKLRESTNEYNAFHTTEIVTPGISGLSCKKKHIVEDELPCSVRTSSKVAKLSARTQSGKVVTLSTCTTVDHLQSDEEKCIPNKSEGFNTESVDVVRLHAPSVKIVCKLSERESATSKFLNDFQLNSPVPRSATRSVASAPKMARSCKSMMARSFARRAADYPGTSEAEIVVATLDIQLNDPCSCTNLKSGLNLCPLECTVEEQPACCSAEDIFSKLTEVKLRSMRSLEIKLSRSSRCRSVARTGENPIV